MQPKANIDGNVLFDDMYMAYDPYKMLMEEWISPKGEYNSQRHAQHLYKSTHQKGMRTFAIGAQWNIAAQWHDH